MSELILEAVKKGDAARVRELLAQNPALADARARTGESAVLLAMYYGRENVAKMLVDRGANLDIFAATAVGSVTHVREQLRKDPGLVRSYSPDGFTPLHLAAHFGQVAVAEALIEAGADLNAVSRNQTFAVANTPLDAAIAGGKPECVKVAKLLLERGADPNARSHGDVAPLHEATQQGDMEFIRLLLAFGADVNVPKQDGTTPLAIAFEKGNEEIAGLLRRHGAR